MNDDDEDDMEEDDKDDDHFFNFALICARVQGLKNVKDNFKSFVNFPFSTSFW